MKTTKGVEVSIIGFRRVGKKTLFGGNKYNVWEVELGCGHKHQFLRLTNFKPSRYVVSMMCYECPKIVG